MIIENENNFRSAVLRGFNLFLGAGFSVLAFNERGESLPVGPQLKTELLSFFKLSEQLKNLNLGELCTIIETTKQRELRVFLERRFKVANYDARYSVLDELNIKTIFTTNIDDLLYNLFEKHYLNDISLYGPRRTDRGAINFVPLHGIIVNENQPFIFSMLELTSTFQADPDRMYKLTNLLQEFPTLFWGHSLADADILQALSPKTIGQRSHKEKWIVLRNPDEPSKTLFKALDFSIIQSDTSEMLDYLTNSELYQQYISITTKEPTHQLLPMYAIPDINKVPVRPLKYFHEGDVPTWHDIFENRIYKTSHYRKVINLINTGKTTVVLGIVASGKTTLLMQIANDLDFDGHKLICDTLTEEEALFILNKLNGEKAIIFLDNCSDSIEAFNIFSRESNTQVIGFDRDSNYEIASHMLENVSTKNIYDITPLSEEDIQGIYSFMPLEMRNSTLITPEAPLPSIFEVIETNTRQELPRLHARFKSLLERLKKDEPLHDLLVMMAYVHTCRTAVSFDMALAFLRDQIKSYHDVIDMILRLGSLIHMNPIELADAEQDFFIPRSTIIAEAILKAVDTKSFQRVFLKFHKEVSPYRIYNYNIFKRYAFDADHAKRAFPDWKEGLDFYERVYQDDHSPYLRQQGALYLARLGHYKEAFKWIEEAVLRTQYKVFSIRNSHAIILFNANIKHAEERKEDLVIRTTLDESMNILTECHKADLRKIYHAETFARQALSYWNVYKDNKAKNYLHLADKWLKEEEPRSHSQKKKQELQALSLKIQEILHA